MAHKRKITEVEPYIAASEYFIKLTPEVMRNSSSAEDTSQSKTIWYVNGGSSDSLYSNYHAYLFDAHHKIANCLKVCDKWCHKYRYQKVPLGRLQQTQQTQRKLNEQNQKVQILKLLLDELEGGGEVKTGQDSLQSIGESSGYESFMPDDVDVEEIVKEQQPWKISTRKADDIELDLSEDLFMKGNVQLGELKKAIFGEI